MYLHFILPKDQVVQVRSMYVVHYDHIVVSYSGTAIKLNDVWVIKLPAL